MKITKEILENLQGYMSDMSIEEILSEENAQEFFFGEFRNEILQRITLIKVITEHCRRTLPRYNGVYDFCENDESYIEFDRGGVTHYVTQISKELAQVKVTLSTEDGVVSKEYLEFLPNPVLDDIFELMEDLFGNSK